MQARRLFLWAGVAAPLLCYGAFLAASLAYPEMRHAKQYVSELGGPQAAHPFIFNLGVGLGGAAGVLAGRGFFLALRALGGGLFPAGLTAILAAVGGGAIIVSGLFPWPDPRHQWVNLGLAIQFAPLAVVWGLSKRRDFLGPEAPIVVALGLDQFADAGGHAHQDRVVLAAGFQQQDLRSRVFAQAVGQHAAGRAGADDDVVVAIQSHGPERRSR